MNKKRIPAQHVVGAGLGRTGTMSFKTALNKLPNMAPIFHMQDSLRSPHLYSLWSDLGQLTPLPVLNNTPVWPPKFHEFTSSEEQEQRVEILKAIFGVDQSHWTLLQPSLYRSVVDFPTCIFFRDMIEVYHDMTQDRRAIKVILTTRESGTKWANSALDAIMNWHPSRRRFGVKVLFWTVAHSMDRMLHNCFSRYMPPMIRDEDVDELAGMHDVWNDYVREVMVKYAAEYELELDEVFLEYQVKEGWEPLCDFLGIEGDDCPTDEAFPHVNDKAYHRMVLSFINFMGFVFILVVVVVVVLVPKWLLPKIRRRSKPKQE